MPGQTDTQKKEIVEKILALSKQRPITELCEEFDIPRSSFYEWRAALEEAGEISVTESPEERKRRMIEQFTEEQMEASISLQRRALKAYLKSLDRIAAIAAGEEVDVTYRGKKTKTIAHPRDSLTAAKELREASAGGLFGDGAALSLQVEGESGVEKEDGDERRVALPSSPDFTRAKRVTVEHEDGSVTEVTRKPAQMEVLEGEELLDGDKEGEGIV